MQVAFRLLDKDFPDEQVRAFATKVVEYNVKSDTLEDYLLQLIQVCILYIYVVANCLENTNPYTCILNCCTGIEV